MIYKEISLPYEGGTRTWVRIAKKSDGKNKSDIDGTWITKEKFDALVTEKASPDIDYTTNDEALKALTSIETVKYQPQDILFWKKFPKGNMIVEGFAEAVLGLIITEFIQWGIIPEEYADCFSPADVVVINNEFVLSQPFAQGYAPIFKLQNPSQQKRNTWAEVLLKKLFNVRYEHIIKDCTPSGLSFLFMISILLGNYSFHSGNLFWTEQIIEGKPIRIFKLLDYGAGLRYYGNTRKNNDIFTSLDLTIHTFNVHKHYTNYYRNMDGFFEAVVAHAERFKTNLDEKPKIRDINIVSATPFKEERPNRESLERKRKMDSNQDLVSFIIKDKVKKVYHFIIGNTPDEQDQKKIQTYLFKYILNQSLPNMSPNELANSFSDNICLIFFDRIRSLSFWKRSQKEPSLRDSLGLYRKLSSNPYNSPDRSKRNRGNNHQIMGTHFFPDQDLPLSSETNVLKKKNNESLLNEPHTPSRENKEEETKSDKHTDLDSLNQDSPEAVAKKLFSITWNSRHFKYKIPQGTTKTLANPKQIAAHLSNNGIRKDRSERLANVLMKQKDDPKNLQKLVEALNDMLAIAAGHEANKDGFAVAIKAIRTPANCNKAFNTGSFQKVVRACKTAILDIMESLSEKGQLRDYLDGLEPIENHGLFSVTEEPVKPEDILFKLLNSNISRNPLFHKPMTKSAQRFSAITSPMKSTGHLYSPTSITNVSPFQSKVALTSR